MKYQTVTFPEILAFGNSKTTLKAQALKVLEESAELVEAVKGPEISNEHTLYEFCDVLQALGNLAYAMDWEYEDIAKEYSEVIENNKKRGRYQ